MFTLFDKVKNSKLFRYIFIALLVIVLLLVLTTKTEQSNSVLSDNLSYVNNLEAKLEKVLSKVDGAGNVKVAITVESGMETVLAMKTIKTETANGIEIEETPILINGKTVTLMEKYPKIKRVHYVDGEKCTATSDGYKVSGGTTDESLIVVKYLSYQLILDPTKDMVTV